MSEHDPGAALARQAAAEVAPEVGAFLGTIFGSASFEIDGMLGQQFNLWRLKRWIRVASRAQRLLEDAGLTAEQVPFKTSVPLAEGASLEEDESLVDRWAALLANAAGKVTEVPASFAQALAQLEPESARLLDHLYASHMTAAPHLRAMTWVHTPSRFDMDDQTFQYYVDSLIRLGLARVEVNAGPNYAKVGVTAYGAAFVRACQPPGTPQPPILIAEASQIPPG